MKGGGIGLFMLIFFIALIFVISLYFLGFASINVFGFACEQDTIGQVNIWIEKMVIPGAQDFKDEFRVADCVEYINKEGVKFKPQKEPQKFFAPKSVGGYQINFEFEGFDFSGTEERIPPRSDSYDVTIKPPNLITIHKSKAASTSSSGTSGSSSPQAGSAATPSQTPPKGTGLGSQPLQPP